MTKAEIKKICMEKCGQKIWSAGSGDFCKHHNMPIDSISIDEVSKLRECYKPKDKVNAKGLFCPDCDGLIAYTDRDEAVYDCKPCYICGVMYGGNMCHYCHFDPEEKDRKMREADEKYRREHNLPPIGFTLNFRKGKISS